MQVLIHENALAMGRDTATRAADILSQAIALHGEARLIVATGASQFSVLDQLTADVSVDWSCVDGFHLDEYVGLDDQHPASFCRYLWERFVSRVPLRSFTFLRGTAEPCKLLTEVGEKLTEKPIDLALVGIGENGHLAFNDPPADFETDSPYLIVKLDEACRQQQVGEGWFASLSEVPTEAFSMSIRQIMKSTAILCSVPDARKATAVQNTLEGDISPAIPASILREHPNVVINLDRQSASLLAK